MNVLKFVIKHYSLHLIPVWCIAGPLGWFGQDISIPIFATLFTVIIDADHLVDYLLYPERRGFNLREALGCAYFLSAPRIYLPLHSYDLHIAVTALLLWWGYTSFALSWLVGFVVHIVTDEVLGHSTGNVRLRNVLLYRLVNRFDRRLYDKSL